MKLTKRGKRVRAISIVLALALVYWVSGNVWWTGDEGYCVGSMVECVL
jgi:hypothetical protein